MYKLIAFLLFLIAALQYRLWLGDGGIREYREISQRIEELRQEGERRKIRNAALAADILDLRDGTDAIEERARHDLGMIKEGETFVQIFDADTPASAPHIQADSSVRPESTGKKPGTPPAKAKPHTAKPARHAREPE